MSDWKCSNCHAEPCNCELDKIPLKKFTVYRRQYVETWAEVEAKSKAEATEKAQNKDVWYGDDGEPDDQEFEVEEGWG